MMKGIGRWCSRLVLQSLKIFALVCLSSCGGTKTDRLTSTSLMETAAVTQLEENSRHHTGLRDRLIKQDELLHGNSEDEAQAQIAEIRHKRQQSRMQDAPELLASDSLASTKRAAEQPAPVRPKWRKYYTCPGKHHIDTTQKVVALTFDDGPSVYTKALLDLLAKKQVLATFFVIGENVPPHARLLRRAYREGHVIGNHTLRHYNLANMGREKAWYALTKANQLIYKQIKVYPRLFRSPYGSCNSESLKMARELGLISIMWNVTSDDYHADRTNAQKIAEDVLAKVQPGSIIDLHDGGGDRHKTVEATGIIIDKLRALGYQFVTIEQILGEKSAYYSAKEWKKVISTSSDSLERNK